MTLVRLVGGPRGGEVVDRVGFSGRVAFLLSDPRPATLLEQPNEWVFWNGSCAWYEQKEPKDMNAEEHLDWLTETGQDVDQFDLADEEAWT